MSRDHDNKERLQAVGTTLAVSPSMREYRDVALLMLESGSTDEEILSRLSALIEESDFGFRAFLGINRNVSRLPADAALRKLAKSWGAKIGKRPFGKIVAEWIGGGSGHWMANYALSWAKSGDAPALKESSVQWTGVLNVGADGDKVPLVIAVAGPLSDPEQVANDFLDRCYQEFPAETWARKTNPERDAQRFALFHAGKSDSDIARAELEADGRLEACANDREKRQEIQVRANSVLVTRKRWDNHMTKLLGVLSPDSE